MTLRCLPNTVPFTLGYLLNTVPFLLSLSFFPFQSFPSLAPHYTLLQNSVPYSPPETSPLGLGKTVSPVLPLYSPVLSL